MSVPRGAQRFMVALAIGSTALVAVPASHAVAGRTAHARATTSLAGHRWRHRVQVDGQAGQDAVVLIGGKDLKLDSFGNGIGHVLVRVHLANSRRTLSSRQFMTYLSVRKPWTPWLGAASLDHRGGKEIMVGFSTGAHSQFFTVLNDQAGRLRELAAPARTSWGANSSFGTGNFGWRCTSTGVESRSVFPGGGSPTYRIVRNRYVWRTRRVGPHEPRRQDGRGGLARQPAGLHQRLPAFPLPRPSARHPVTAVDPGHLPASRAYPKRSWSPGLDSFGGHGVVPCSVGPYTSEHGHVCSDADHLHQVSGPPVGALDGRWRAW